MRKHAVDGAGIFDTISNFFKKLVASNAAQTLASAATRAAATDIGKSAISSAKTVGKELATSAIATAKDLAITKGKELIDWASTKAQTPKTTEIIKKLTGLEPNVPAITQRSKDILAGLIHSGAAEATSGAVTNINNLMMGHGIKTNAIRIEDLVRKMNGAGLRLA